jgi:hypothetical protein
VLLPQLFRLSETGLNLGKNYKSCDSQLSPYPAGKRVSNEEPRS